MYLTFTPKPSWQESDEEQEDEEEEDEEDDAEATACLVPFL